MNVPCDDCGKPCGIYICTGCYEKAKSSLIPGLRKALKILDGREATAKALGYNESYLEAFKNLRVFLNAEIWRQENPEEAKKSRTILG